MPDLLTTLAGASAAADMPTIILVDLTASNSGYVSKLGAVNTTFRVCGGARDILVAAVNVTTTDDPQLGALLRTKDHIESMLCQTQQGC
jgi:hypothetical protein